MSVVRELAVEIDHPPAGIPVIYCDGTAGAAFRPDVDVELSHWIPNRTPRPYKADTSTEIAFRFLDDRGPPLTSAIAKLREREPGPASWELATLLSPFEKSTGRPFPVVATVSRDGRPAASGLSPEVVGECLAGAFAQTATAGQ